MAYLAPAGTPGTGAARGLWKILCFLPSCLLTLEEGAVIQETFHLLPDHPLFRGFPFRRKARRMASRPSGPARRRGRRKVRPGDGWGLQQAHLRRLMLLR